MPLEDYLDQYVFANSSRAVEAPEEKDVNGFNEYMKLYKKGLAAESCAADIING